MEPDEFKMILKEVMEEERKSFWIEPERHYQDHQQVMACHKNMEEIRKNHDFISSVRSGAKIAQKAGITVAITSFIVFVVGAVYVQIKGG